MPMPLPLFILVMPLRGKLLKDQLSKQVVPIPHIYIYRLKFYSMLATGITKHRIIPEMNVRTTSIC